MQFIVKKHASAWYQPKGGITMQPLVSPCEGGTLMTLTSQQPGIAFERQMGQAPQKGGNHNG